MMRWFYMLLNTALIFLTLVVFIDFHPNSSEHHHHHQNLKSPLISPPHHRFSHLEPHHSSFPAKRPAQLYLPRLPTSPKRSVPAPVHYVCLTNTHNTTQSIAPHPLYLHHYPPSTFTKPTLTAPTQHNTTHSKSHLTS
ncbi:uncharacterized protein LY89DRAFT_680097 [Mollisia scopiformis]|uniref:Uncharacterized protein n=1 Tax=Mollisia scopiformis TaxID=149040 RepID=A0A194XSQ0_MOLSC|nr:uncharacterized protein LY89DRAFT_680097 [Mollisia scopiformis]KUJ23330.1 hypothetical protein LY89DRAFT_680097 [Mollisia scopiformis]